MNIALTGATGFVGRRVGELLRGEGHTVRAISTRGGIRAADLAGCEAVINLAGEPVAQRWTAAARERIRASRVEGTRALVAALAAKPPAVLVSASAVGYYGSRGDQILNELAPPASDFLGLLAADWEREAREAEKLGVRVVTLRIAVVLGSGGGALSQMLLPFKLGVGGRIGDGKQWMAWIHRDDLASLIAFAVKNPTLTGAVNAAAPESVTNAEFTRELGRALHRPTIFPVPRVALKLLFGEMADVIFASQRVVPEAALRAGFQFQFPDIRGALEEIVRS